MSTSKPGEFSTGIRKRLEAVPLIGKLLSRIIALPNPFFHFRSSPSAKAYRKVLNSVLAENPKAKLLNIGSRTGRPEFVNLDIEDHGNASIIGDAAAMPIEDNTFDFIENVAVVEHVRDPQAVARECYRVLKPGGKVFVSCPFFQVFHPDPIDMQRYTVEGLANLFGQFTCIERGVELGPSTAACQIIRDYLATLVSFNSNALYNAAQIVFGAMLYPIKFLDYFLVHSKFAYMMCSSVYFVGVKEPAKPAKD